MRAEERPPPRKATRTVQLRQENTQKQAQVQKLAPHLIQANTLLQCSTTELQQIIEQEQQENPALDSLDERPEPGEAGCRLCPGSRVGSCAHCPFSRDAHPLADAHPLGEAGRDEGDAGPSLAESHDILAARGEDRAEDERLAARAEHDFGHAGAEDGGDGEFDPLLLARTQTSLADQLLLHLRATSRSPEEVRVAEYLVDCLDERGYLQVDVDEACAVLRVPCRLVTQGIERLQACDPPGVGARDVRECLLLQMRHGRDEMRHGGDEAAFDPVAFAILSDHWDAFVQGRTSALARKLGVPARRVEAAAAFIRTLTPNPAAGFRMPWDSPRGAESKAIRPDVIIRRSGVGFSVEVLGFDNTTLQVNPYYRGLYDAIRASRQSGQPARDGARRLTADHQKHVIAYVERANMFLKNLQQRRRTIQKITQALIECQQGFLETGGRAFLRPLTRTQLAKMVEMHESTVSRALLYKYVQLPSQEVVSFDVFFENAVTVKGTIAALIADEAPDAPLSDQAIVDALAARGQTVARRTVVKYREEMRIPASYLRRRR
jgi:RNA polymerase sigma-54 factor